MWSQSAGQKLFGENFFKLFAFQNEISCQFIDSPSPSRIKGSNVQYEYLSANLIKKHLF